MAYDISDFEVKMGICNMVSLPSSVELPNRMKRVRNELFVPSRRLSRKSNTILGEVGCESDLVRRSVRRGWSAGTALGD